MATPLFGTAPAPTEGTALNAIPAEFQDQLSRAALKKQLAQQLLAQGAKGTSGQMVGNVYVAPSKFAALSPLLSSLAGAVALTSANKDQSQVQSDYQDARAADLAKVTAKLQGTPGSINGDGTVTPDGAPDVNGAINLADASKFAETRALAATWRKTQDARTAEAQKLASPESAVRFAQTGNPADLAAGVASAPVDLHDESGAVIGHGVRQPDGKMSFVPKGQTINVNNNADKGALDYFKGFQPQLESGRTDAIAANQTLQGTSLIRQLLQSGGVNTGFGADKVTLLQKMGKVLGFDVPADAANNETWKAEITPLIAQQAKAFGTGNGFTDKDAELVGASIANPNQDPRAAMNILDRMEQRAQAKIDNHGKFVDSVQTAATGMGLPASMVEPYRYNSTILPNPATITSATPAPSKAAAETAKMGVPEYGDLIQTAIEKKGTPEGDAAAQKLAAAGYPLGDPNNPMAPKPKAGGKVFSWNNKP